MGLGQVHDVNEVADTRTVTRGIVVAKDAQLLAHANSGLGEEGHQVLGHTVGQLANLGTRMGSDGIEVAQQDGLDGAAAADNVGDDVLTNLLGGAIG